MTELMRRDLRKITRKLDNAHAGLLIQRGLSDWEEGEKNKKAALIETISNVKPSGIYELALNRWIGITHSHERFSHLILATENRLFTGLATSGTLETGIYTHHSYAMPMLAGSSIKGAARSYAASINLPQDYQDILFGSNEESNEESSEDISGALIWHDAWWIPYKQERPFKQEIITVHHQAYYNGSAEKADGTESPIPNQQLATSGGFYFVIEGNKNWANYACQLLKAMLATQGMGAKTASGYGYFHQSEAHEKEIDKRHRDWQEKQLDSKQQSGEISLEDKLSHKVQNIPANQLAETLGRGFNKFLKELQISEEDASKIAALAWQHHQKEIETWSSADKNSTEGKAYKKMQKLRNNES